MKLPKWIERIFCKHNYTEDATEDAKELVQEFTDMCERHREAGILVSYSYPVWYVCTKCGKKTVVEKAVY